MADDGLGEDDGSATARVRTGRHGQWLDADGWIASHADSGTPGPHVHVSTNDRQNAVLKTSQVPGFVAALTRVAGRIDRQWADGAGDDYPFGPDHNDPAVIRQERIAELEFFELLHARLPEVVALLFGAEEHHAASAGIAELLGVDERAVERRLRGVDLFGFTRVAAAARTGRLRALLAD